MVSIEVCKLLNDADGNSVSEQLKKLFGKLNRNQVPDTKGITHSLGIADVHRQEDASEYFQKILSKVNPDVTKIYEGTIKETITCKKEHPLKNDSSPFTLIPLSINNPSSGIISVEGAWKDHFKSTEATLYCSSCESETLAQFESKINVFPQILALHLDRLDIFSGQKNTCKVKIPSTLTDKGQNYELYAIANHHGTPRGGHYKAFIKPNGDESWWIFDDSHVRKMEELQRENLLNSPAADLLFYKKISSDDLKAENTLEKGNDRYPSQDHRKRPSKSKPEKEEEEEEEKETTKKQKMSFPM
ncbi:putative ubiquitin carboxyl-terminal hydrolase 50 [Anguilla anguilla]|uniref:putative ubiquitin carboxyl-terminal hydrolase 50 n=1 Tax=Anguilla anguilla TaxID=7936 RepID=UPI0015ADCC74|nr:putative ubiquitin carboxyl-terminal hydrolase 50 [Anguilla anguilla]